MNKATYNIYKLDEFFFGHLGPESVIRNHFKSQNSNNVIYEEINCKVKKGNFKLLLYVNKPKKNNPTWLNMLTTIVEEPSQLNGLKSLYPSFVLFFYKTDQCFAISGGAGHMVIDSLLDRQFGFKIIERLIDISKDDVRQLSESVFLGIELASNRFFKSDYSFNDDDGFGKYYKGVHVFIDNERLRKIGIETSKKKLLVKGQLGFRIDTKINFDNLQRRVEKISTLLSKKPNIELNPFKKLSNHELNRIMKNGKKLKDLLDQYLCNYYFLLHQANKQQEIYHPSLLNYLNSSRIIVRFKDFEIEIPTYQSITTRVILGYLNIDVENVQFPKFLELSKEVRIWILNDENNNKVYESKLIDWYFGEVKYDLKNYIKFENEWFHYSINFLEDLNKRLDQLSSQIELTPMKEWPLIHSTEEDYNNQYEEDIDFIIGDGVFHKFIEIADLIQWKNEELFIYHVKNGFDRNLRILQSQLINSIKVLTEFRSNIDSIEVKDYYNKLKLKASDLSSSIPSFVKFKEILGLKTIHFVFAFATKTDIKSKEDVFNEIKKSNSNIAKIALLHSNYTARKHNVKFSISKIVRE